MHLAQKPGRRVGEPGMIESDRLRLRRTGCSDVDDDSDIRGVDEPDEGLMLRPLRSASQVLFSSTRPAYSMPQIKSSGDVQPINGKSFRLALIQLGSTGADKAKNLEHAKAKVAEASAGGSEGKKPDVIVLPEVFNSPYGAQHFPKYAEVIGWDKGKGKAWDVASSESESVKMLSKAAKDAGVWLFGGQSAPSF